MRDRNEEILELLRLSLIVQLTFAIPPDQVGTEQLESVAVEEFVRKPIPAELNERFVLLKSVTRLPLAVTALSCKEICELFA